MKNFKVRRGRATFWTSRKRVLDGLRRAAREIWADDPDRLPSSTTTYMARLKEVAPVEPGRRRGDYPAQDVILNHFESMNHAWSALGFIVETRVRKVASRVMTPEIHERLKVCYQYQGQKRQERPPGVLTVRELAEEVGVQHHVLCNYASKQGWVTPKEKPWARAELKLLDKYAHLSPAIIQKHMKAAGFSRSETGIRVMRKRRNAHKGSPYYSAQSMMRLFGFDLHQLDRNWLLKYAGDLPFEMKGTLRGNHNGDTKLFHVDTIREFVFKHPDEIDFRKVDKMWFLWLVSGGRVKLVAQSDRLGKRAEGYQPHRVTDYAEVRKPMGPKPKRAVGETV